MGGRQTDLPYLIRTLIIIIKLIIIDDLIFSITACSIGVVLDSSWRLNNMNSIRSWSVEEHSIIIVSPFFRRALYPGLRS